MENFYFFIPLCLKLFFLSCSELELHKQEHIQRRWAQVPRRQDGLSTEQQPEERHPGVARW